MTKQKEVFYILQDVRLGELTEYEATVKLQELGVVIRVDNGADLTGCCIARLEPLIKEK